jgi:hypothetical protein
MCLKGRGVSPKSLFGEPLALWGLTLDTGDWAIPQADRAEIEKLPGDSCIYKITLYGKTGKLGIISQVEFFQ